MVRELREKGLGEEEVARAHAQWLEEEDDKALTGLMRGIKRGFRKGRKRVEVQCFAVPICRAHTNVHTAEFLDQANFVQPI